MAHDLTSTLFFQDSELEIHKLVVGDMDNNVYVVRCAQTGEAVLLDAANEHEKLLEMCAALNVGTVLETHGHWDHIQAVPAVREAGHSVWVHEADAHMLNDAGYDELIENDSRIEVGRLRLHAVLTPGHTPGSVSFKIEDHPFLFTGDTLFPGGPGNTKFGGDFDTIIDSIDRLMFAAYDEAVAVLPGHGDPTTIGAERPHLDSWVDRGW